MTRSRPLALVCGCLAFVAGPLAAADRTGFLLEVVVDGAPVTEYAARGRVYVEARKGKEFTLRLSNPTSERVAVALSVDGRNVVDAKRTTALAATKWILGPGQTVEVPGWQVSRTTSRRFYFTDVSSSYARWLGDTANVGTIEAVFFREKRRPPRVTQKDFASEPSREAGAAGRDERARPAAPGTGQKSAAEGYAATGIGAETGFPVEWVAFEEDPVPAARIALRYEFRSELVRLGVVPREDDLLARDRAHGFEHDYAPDPFRR